MKLAIQLRSPFPIDAPSFSTLLSHLVRKTPGAVSRLLAILQTSPHSLGTIVPPGKRVDRADELRDQEGDHHFLCCGTTRLAHSSQRGETTASHWALQPDQHDYRVTCRLRP